MDMNYDDMMVSNPVIVCNICGLAYRLIRHINCPTCTGMKYDRATETVQCKECAHRYLWTFAACPECEEPNEIQSPIMDDLGAITGMGFSPWYTEGTREVA